MRVERVSAKVKETGQRLSGFVEYHSLIETRQNDDGEQINRLRTIRKIVTTNDILLPDGVFIVELSGLKGRWYLGDTNRCLIEV